MLKVLGNSGCPKFCLYNMNFKLNNQITVARVFLLVTPVAFCLVSCGKEEEEISYVEETVTVKEKPLKEPEEKGMKAPHGMMGHGNSDHPHGHMGHKTDKQAAHPHGSIQEAPLAWKLPSGWKEEKGKPRKERHKERQTGKRTKVKQNI